MHQKKEITPDLQRLREMAKNEEPLDCATSQQIESLLSILQDEKKILAKNKFFKEANACSNVISYVSKYQEASKKRENQVIAKKNFSVVKQNFDESFRKFDEETKALERELTIKQEDRLEAFLNNQQEEMNEFELRWNSDKKLRTYNKSTSKLNNMKMRIPYLLIDNQFEEAEASEKDIANKTRQEVFDRYFTMQSDYDRALRHLLKKQEQELDQFRNDCYVELDKFEQDRKKLRQGYLNRELKLKTKEEIIDNPDKLWIHSQTERLGNTFNGKSRSTPPSPSSKMRISDFPRKDINSLILPPLKTRIQTMNKNANNK